MAKRLKELRERAGLSQARLAEKVGIHLRTYQQWEYALRTPLFDETMVRLADVLNVSLDELAGRDWPRGERPPASTSPEPPKPPRGRKPKGK
jgi:transcriptional regulator with XRE-family HTH domain